MTFIHKYLKNVTCEILQETKKGYKVKQTEIISKTKIKRTIKYYSLIDFDKNKGIWNNSGF